MAHENGGGGWTVYLSGEIHSDWRDRIRDGVNGVGLPVQLASPVTDHAASDDCGSEILGTLKTTLFGEIIRVQKLTRSGREACWTRRISQLFGSVTNTANGTRRLMPVMPQRWVNHTSRFMTLN